MAAIGHGALKEGQVINKMLEKAERVRKETITDEQVLEEINEAGEKHMLPAGKGKGGILVRGMNDLAVRFPKCCNPLPGDEIVGFVTRGRGVSIHRTDCVNVLQLPEDERARLIEAEWELGADGEVGGKYMVGITIYANNRSGLLADISKIMTDNNIDIMAMHSKASKQGVATTTMSFEVSSREELNRIAEKIKQVPSVLDVDRQANG